MFAYKGSFKVTTDRLECLKKASIILSVASVADVQNADMYVMNNYPHSF